MRTASSTHCHFRFHIPAFIYILFLIAFSSIYTVPTRNAPLRGTLELTSLSVWASFTIMDSSRNSPRHSPARVSPLPSPNSVRGTPRPTPSPFPNDAPYVKAEKRDRFEPTYNDGLGIHMTEMGTPMSPDSIYRVKGAMYAPLSPVTPRPQWARTPTSVSSMARSRTDPVTQRLIEHRATQAARWTVHWQTPLMMVTSFIVGIALAFGQHRLYTFLHHKIEDNEDKKVRWVLYGRALAYFSKVAFAACVILVYRQRIWTTFRKRALSVLSIDQLFLATEDPSLFLNWEAISKAPLVTAMAMVIWLIPVATIIFSPGALTFGWYSEASSVELLVPNLNFSVESNIDWRAPMKMKDGTVRKSLMFYNTTDTAGGPGFFDYYDQPSTDVSRVALINAFSLAETALNRPDARLVSCSGNYNCSYSTSFLGPSYKCEQVTEGAATDNAKLEELGAPFNTAKLIPNGKYVYFAHVDDGEYARPQDPRINEPGGIPPPEVDINSLGLFKAEPIIWIGYAVNSTQKIPTDSVYAKNWTWNYDQHIFRCIHYETKYTVHWNYTESFLKTDVTREFLKPIVDTSFSRNPNGTPDWGNPIPTENYVSPRTPEEYKKVAAYHVMGQSLRKFLKGSIELTPPIPGPSFARVNSELSQTRLVSNATNLPTEDLPGQIQDFYTNIILSLFSAPQLLVVSEEKVMVNRTRYQSAFVYSPEKLWMCYAPVISAVLIVLIIGAWTIFQDGTTFSVGFSRVMVTTRNTTLDDISRGACLGNDPFPIELMHTKLQFGVLNEHADEYVGADALTGVQHCAFGVPSELSKIEKGMPYAGLKRRMQRKPTKDKMD